MARPRSSARTRRRSSEAQPKPPRVADRPRKAGASAITPKFRYVLSSGLFGLPANAQSVDWMVVNDSPVPEVIRVTVFQAGVGQKTVAPPGPLVVTINPGATAHNANSVGPDQPFVPGFYYEIVMETNDRRILPAVHAWQDQGNTTIAGTLIPAGGFVEI